MVKPPGDNFTVKINENIQWTWKRHHFMLYITPAKESGTSYLSLWIDQSDPVLQIYVEHEADDCTILKSWLTLRVRVGDWIDDFLSYFSAYTRLRIVSEATREKYRPDMEAFWQQERLQG